MATKKMPVYPPHIVIPDFAMLRGMGFAQESDANKDGKVTRAEFDTAANAQFDKYAKGGGITPRWVLPDGLREKVRDLQTRRFDRSSTPITTAN